MSENTKLSAAPLSSYSQADRDFFQFWYSHMDGDVMRPPLAGTWHSTARYIWDAALASRATDAPAQGEQMPVALNVDIDAEHAEFCEWLDTVKEGARAHQTPWNGWIAAKTVAACKALAASPVAADKPVAQDEAIMLNGMPVERIQLDYLTDYLNRWSMFDGSDLLQAFNKLVAHYVANRAATADAAPACRYPLCQPEAEQQRIAAEAHRQLYTGEVAPAGAVAVLEQAARMADSVGHHWSGAPALAFFELATKIRALKSAAAEVTPAPATGNPLGLGRKWSKEGEMMESWAAPATAAASVPDGWREFIENIATPYSEPLNSLCAYKDKASRVAFMQDLRAKAATLLAAAQSAERGREGCSCAVCKPNTWDGQRMILCATCGNKRCPHATDHRNACTNSNEPGQPGSSYANVRATAATDGGSTK